MQPDGVFQIVHADGTRDQAGYDATTMEMPGWVVAGEPVDTIGEALDALGLDEDVLLPKVAVHHVRVYAGQATLEVSLDDRRGELSFERVCGRWQPSGDSIDCWVARSLLAQLDRWPSTTEAAQALTEIARERLDR